jgi:hypothetical protein
MPDPVPINPLTAARAIQQARLVALAILAGQIVFLGIATFLVANGSRSDAPPVGAPGDPSRTLLAVAMFLFAVLVPIAFLLRRRLLAPVDGGTPAPDLYLKAQIVFFGLCEMPTLMFLVVALVQQDLMPGAPLAMLTIAVQALNLPKVDDLPVG